MAFVKLNHKKVQTKFSRPKATDMVAIMLKKLVVDHKMEPGDKLPSEKELIDLFQVGRGTIRESLKSLEIQGIIEKVPGRNGGNVVAEVDHVPVMQFVSNYLHFQNTTHLDVYFIRKILEPIMAESAVGRLSEQDFADLEEQIHICRSYLDNKGTRLECRKAELDFHDIIARGCPNHFLSFQCRFMNYMLYNYLHFKNLETEVGREFAEKNVEYHELIVKELREGNKENVRLFMTAHMNSAFDYLCKLKATIEDSLVSIWEKRLM